MTKAELEAKLYDTEQEHLRLEAALADAEKRVKEAEVAEAHADERAENAADEALKPLRIADEWLGLLREHLDRMRAGLVRRAQAGKTLWGWERWEERARECLSEAQGLLAVYWCEGAGTGKGV